MRAEAIEYLLTFHIVTCPIQQKSCPCQLIVQFLVGTVRVTKHLFQQCNFCHYRAKCQAMDDQQKMHPLGYARILLVKAGHAFFKIEIVLYVVSQQQKNYGKTNNGRKEILY